MQNPQKKIRDCRGNPPWLPIQLPAGVNGLSRGLSRGALSFFKCRQVPSNLFTALRRSAPWGGAAISPEFSRYRAICRGIT